MKNKLEAVASCMALQCVKALTQQGGPVSSVSVLFYNKGEDPIGFEANRADSEMAEKPDTEETIINMLDCSVSSLVSDLEQKADLEWGELVIRIRTPKYTITSLVDANTREPKTFGAQRNRENVDCKNCQSSSACVRCEDCVKCYACEGCHDCFKSNNLTNASYVAFGVQLTEAEYRELMSEMAKSQVSYDSMPCDEPETTLPIGDG